MCALRNVLRRAIILRCKALQLLFKLGNSSLVTVINYQTSSQFFLAIAAILLLFIFGASSPPRSTLEAYDPSRTLQGLRSLGAFIVDPRINATVNSLSKIMF